MENRREFLKNGLILCLGAGGLMGTVSRVAAFPHADDARWGMIIDTSRCSGCQSCMVACKLQNKTAEGHFNTSVRGLETGDYPNATFIFDTHICRHCTDAPCVSACPTGAAFVHESGLVMTDWNRCDGNGACMDACPYDARFHDSRFSEKTDKCDLCLDRISQGLVPACVENCPSNARIFGRIDKPEGEFAAYLSAMSLKEKNLGAVHILQGKNKKEQK